MVAKVLPAESLSHYPRGWGQKVKIQSIQNMVMLHIKFIEIKKRSLMVATFSRRPPYIPTLEPKGQNSPLSELCHVAYRINGNHAMQQHGSKCFAHRTPPPPPTLGMGSKRPIQLFQNMVMLHII